MSYQIYENNFSDKIISLVGISSRGFEIAKLLKVEIESISNIQVSLFELTIDKVSPSSENIKINPLQKSLKGTVIIVDDVLNTGRTLIYASLPFLNIKIEKIQIAVLVDRNHKKFPVSADYKGIELNTTFKEHVSVELNKKKQYEVYLQ